jgi:hypothetical protein
MNVYCIYKVSYILFYLIGWFRRRIGAYPVTVSFCRTTWIRYRKCFIRSMTSYFDHLYSYSKSRWQDKKVYQVLTEFIVTDIPNMAYIVFIDQQKWRWLPPQKVVFVLSIHCLSQQLESTKISLKLWSMLANCMKLFIWCFPLSFGSFGQAVSEEKIQMWIVNRWRTTERQTPSYDKC